MDRFHLFAGLTEESWNAMQNDRVRREREARATYGGSPLEDPLVINAVNEAIRELAMRGTVSVPDNSPKR